MVESGINAGQLLNMSSCYWKACTLHAGVKLDIFSALGAGELTAREVAGRLDLDPRGCETLMNALAAMGLLGKDGERYANAEAARRFLVKGAPGYIGYIIMHHHHLVDGWAQLDSAVRFGEAVETKSHGEERERESFLLGMHNLASGIAPVVAGQLDLAGRRHLLDLGGGPGTWAIAFCRANPALAATIFDRPTTRPIALRVVRENELETRIAFAGGDFTQDPIPGRYDVAWLSQILHSNGPAACEAIVAKTVAALEPGGIILVHEFFLNETKDGPEFPALFSLNMLINNGSGRSYAEAEVRAMLERTGVHDIRRLPFQGPNDSYVIYGTV